MRGGIRLGVGPLAHLLKNRFYLGEVVYRGEVHAGEHEPIVDRGLFAAVQAKLAANAVARKVRLRGSASILTGRIYDDRRNHMSPIHSNKPGVRYRYCVSHALLQNRKEGCWPFGMPFIYKQALMQMIQQPDKITMLYSGDHLCASLAENKH